MSILTRILSADRRALRTALASGAAAWGTSTLASVQMERLAELRELEEQIELLRAERDELATRKHVGGPLTEADILAAARRAHRARYGVDEAELRWAQASLTTRLIWEGVACAVLRGVEPEPAPEQG